MKLRTGHVMRQRDEFAFVGACRTWAKNAVLFGAFIVASCGCHPSDREINSFLQATEASVSSAEYVVQPPDSLELSSAQAAEIDGEHQVIRQDGKITLRLLGEVKVAGMTPTEIGQKLEALLAKYYIDPKVNVRVSGSQSKRYYVFGDNTVARQGPYEYTGRDTLLNALAVAQPNNFAWKSRIKLIRPSADKTQRHEMTVDAERIIMSGKTDQNVLLQEGDIIWVPPTPMAWIGMRLGEVLYPVNSSTQAMGTPIVVKATADAYSASGITSGGAK